MNRKIRNHLFRVIVIFIGLIVIAFIVCVKVYLTPFIKQKIVTSVEVSTNGLYRININDLHISVWSGEVEIKGVSLSQNARLLTQLRKREPEANLASVSLSIEKVAVSRIGWQNYFIGKPLVVGTINITRPEVFFEGTLSNDSIHISHESFISMLPALLSSFTGSLDINGLIVDHGIVHLDFSGQDGVVRQHAHDIHLDMKNISIDTSSYEKNVLFTNELRFDLKGYEIIAADSSFKLSIKHCVGNYADSTFEADSLALTSLSHLQQTGSRYTLLVNELHTTRTDFRQLLMGKKISIGTAEINAPLFYFSKFDPERQKHGKVSGGIPNPLRSSVFKEFELGKLSILNGKFRADFLNHKDTSIHQANKVFLTLVKVRLDDEKEYVGFPYKQMSISMQDYVGTFKKANLVTQIEALTASTLAANIRAKNVRIHPYRSSFSDEINFAANAKFINFNNIVLPSLLEGNSLRSEGMLIEGMHLYVTHNSKNIPSTVNAGLMPYDLMKMIPVPVNLRKILLKNSFIEYKDYAPGMKNPGMLSFENTQVVINNFANDSFRVGLNQLTIIDVQTQIMGKGKLTFNMAIPLMSQKFECKYLGNLERMEASYFNSFLEYANLKISGGNVESPLFEVNVVDGCAKGKMVLLYHDLDPDVIKKNGKERKLYSLLAGVVLKSKRNKGNSKAPKEIQVMYTRKQDDGLLSYIWNSLSDAIVRSVVKEFFIPYVEKKKSK